MKTSKNETLGTLWQLLFGLVLFDSLITYLIMPRLPFAFPVNALLPIGIIVPLLYGGIARALPRKEILIWLGLSFLGFSLGIIFLQEFEAIRFLRIGSALCAFIIGFNAVKENNNQKRFWRVLLFVSAIYSVVCVIALLELAPKYFPVIKAFGFRGGVAFFRPEITTDQNFQIFYLFPGLLALATVFSFKKMAMLFVIAVGALYTTAQLQTRSGTILIFATIFLAYFYSAWCLRKKIILQTAVIGGLALLVILLKLPTILELLSDIIYRFAKDDFDTFWGRVYSATYLFEKVWNPLWWIPQGNADFMSMHRGGKPHFSPTAIFLEGGLLSLLSWFFLALIPVLKLMSLSLRRQLSEFELALSIGAFIALIGTLSLNAPLHEHLWLWMGVAIGVLARHRKAVLQQRYRRQLK